MDVVREVNTEGRTVKKKKTTTTLWFISMRDKAGLKQELWVQKMSIPGNVLLFARK